MLKFGIDSENLWIALGGVVRNWEVAVDDFVWVLGCVGAAKIGDLVNNVIEMVGEISLENGWVGEADFDFASAGPIAFGKAELDAGWLAEEFGDL